DLSGEPVRRIVIDLETGPLGPPAPDDFVLPDLESNIFERASAMQRSRIEYGPPASLGNVVRLDLFKAIQFAVENSRTYQSEMEELYLAALNVTLERHLFTPRPFVTSELRYTGGQQSVDYRSALTATQRVGVRQRLPYGGEIVAEGLVSFINGLRGNVADGENAQLALRGSLPLWRGAGLVNLENLVSSERELIYATREFESFRRRFAVEIATSYFRSLIRYQRLRNRLVNYRNLSDLVIRSEALFAAEKTNALELQRAQQSLLQAEDQLNTAQQVLETDLDDFKLLIGMPIGQPLELVAIEVAVGELDAAMGDPEALAIRYRLDLQTARDRIDDARRGIQIAENRLGPDLNLTGGATLGNRSGEPARRIDNDTAQYDAGLVLDLPIDRLPERNQYRRALIFYEQAKRQSVEVEQNVLTSVRERERGIRAAASTLRIQRAGIDLARKRLEFANERLLTVTTNSTNSTRDVVEAQSSLLSAQDSFDAARADQQIQMLQFLRDTGTLRVDPAAGMLGTAMSRKSE
ncbi:MAG TPA: TolC family protein, partial [Tepidisphaeraceae bacterium]